MQEIYLISYLIIKGKKNICIKLIFFYNQTAAKKGKCGRSKKCNNEVKMKEMKRLYGKFKNR